MPKFKQTTELVFLKCALIVLLLASSAYAEVLHPFKWDIERKIEANDVLVWYEKAEYEDGSRVSRPVGILYNYNLPLRIDILNDFAPPTQTNNQPTPQSFDFLFTSRMHSLDKAVVLQKLNMDSKDQLIHLCSDNEWTGLAYIDDETLHRPIHNFPEALSNSGQERFFKLGQIVCIEK